MLCEAVQKHYPYSRVRFRGPIYRFPDRTARSPDAMLKHRKKTSRFTTTSSVRTNLSASQDDIKSPHLLISILSVDCTVHKHNGCRSASPQRPRTRAGNTQFSDIQLQIGLYSDKLVTCMEFAYRSRGIFRAHHPGRLSVANCLAVEDVRSKIPR